MSLKEVTENTPPTIEELQHARRQARYYRNRYYKLRRAFIAFVGFTVGFVVGTVIFIVRGNTDVTKPMPQETPTPKALSAITFTVEYKPTAAPVNYGKLGALMERVDAETDTKTETVTNTDTDTDTDTVTVKKYTDEEVILACKTVYGEARGCDPQEQALVAWCFCNWADHTGKTLKDMILYPNRFYGYNANNPVTDEIKAIVTDVFDAWSRGDKPLVYEPYATVSDYLFFTGDGKHNWFRNVY